MKTNIRYGSLKLTRNVTRAIQLEWDFVEMPASRQRFLSFPCLDVPVRTNARRMPRRTEKRPLAA